MSSNAKPTINKIDFSVIITVNRANPNGDPLNGNRPRQTYDGFGEISDVCLKRKIRNRLQDMGETIFVQSDDNRSDNFRSLNARYTAAKISNGKEREETCTKWFDVRAFGQVFAFTAKKGSKKNTKSDDLLAGLIDESNEQISSDSVSIGIRGPVTIQSAFSVEPVTPESLQIVKSVNLETNEKEPDKKGSDTMGMKHRINHGIYVAHGSINSQLAQKTGFSVADADKLKKALRSLFMNDESSARPAGSMEVVKVIWWQHNCPNGQYSSAKVHRALKNVKLDEKGYVTYTLDELVGLKPEELDQLEGGDLMS